MNKIYPVYFTCANHFEELIVSVNSLRTICGDKIKDIYIYCDLEDYFSYDQINRLGNCIIKKTVAKMSWGGTKTIENELLAFFEISKEIDANDYIMNVDSDLVFVSSYVLDIVSKINNVDIIGQSLTHTFSPYWDKSIRSSPYTFIQGSCYFIKSSFVSSILKTYGRYRDDILSSVCSLCYVPVAAIPADITISKIVELSKGTIKYFDFFVNRNQSVIHMELTKDSMWKPFGKMMGIKKVGYHNVLKSNKDKDDKKQFVIRRTGGLGDVLLTTPIIKELSKRNPRSEIHILTHYPEVFDNNPYVTSVNNDILTDNFIDLNGCYERQPNMHIIDAYAMDVLGDTNLFDRKIDLYEGNLDRMKIEDLIKTEIDTSKRIVVIHFSNKKYSHIDKVLLNEIIGEMSLSYNVVLIGKKENNDYSGNNSNNSNNGLINLTSSNLSVQTILALINEADLFLGNDSGIFHISSVSQTPSLTLFTTTNPQYRMPVKQYAFYINTSMKCAHCFHKNNIYKKNKPVNFTCSKGFICSKGFDKNKIISEVNKLAKINTDSNKPIIISYPRSGLNWIRYNIEYFSKRRTPGQYTCLHEYGNPIVRRAHSTEEVLGKEFDRCRFYDQEGHPIYKKVILLLRNYKELYIRKADCEKYYPFEVYIKNIKHFDEFEGKKLLIYFEDLMTNFYDTMGKILNFINVKYDFSNYDLEYHKNKSVNMYAKRHDTTSYTKGDSSKVTFHSKKLTYAQKNKIDLFFKQNYYQLFVKYLKRYEEK